MLASVQPPFRPLLRVPIFLTTNVSIGCSLSLLLSGFLACHTTLFDESVALHQEGILKETTTQSIQNPPQYISIQTPVSPLKHSNIIQSGEQDGNIGKSNSQDSSSQVCLKNVSDHSFTVMATIFIFLRSSDPWCWQLGPQRLHFTFIWFYQTS